MNSPQRNNTNQIHPQQNNLPHVDTSQQPHFVQAQRIVNTWPEWKKDACSAATASNDNSTCSSDKK